MISVNFSAFLRANLRTERSLEMSPSVIVVHAKTGHEYHTALVTLVEEYLQGLDARVQHGQKPPVLPARIVLKLV